GLPLQRPIKGVSLTRSRGFMIRDSHFRLVEPGTDPAAVKRKHRARREKPPSPLQTLSCFAGKLSDGRAVGKEKRCRAGGAPGGAPSPLPAPGQRPMLTRTSKVPLDSGLKVLGAMRR